MAQQYLSTDPNAGTPLTGGYLSNDPAAGSARQGESLRGLSATESFFRGPQRPMTESGDPLDAVSRLDALLNRVNPLLQSAAQPQSLSDLVGLLVPSAGGLNVRVPVANMLREGAQAARQAPNWRSVPQDALERLMQWASTPAETIQAQRAAVAPRLAGKAPTLQESLTSAVDAVRKAEPDRVALPGGNAVRPTPRYRDYKRADAGPPAAVSDAPPAAAPPAPARSAPAPAGQSLRLTAEEAQALQALVQQGHDEGAVLQAIAKQRQAGAPRVSGKPALAAAEAKEYQRLLGRGMSPDAALRLIEEQRTFATAKGLPSSEQTRQAVRERNTSGRWD